jgi:23S rRNA (cytidine1920-2'-O)/16S rRNA (cytidine1409-2'-O)-methyltransferase
MVSDDVSLDVAKGRRFVSRGGDKLDHALETFGVDVNGLVAVDVGSSTGGFTDCLLKRGAARVYAVDVGRGQLDYKLRQDPRVVVMEGVNARNLSLAERADFAVIDVAFISLRLVLPAVAGVLSREVSPVGLKADPRSEGVADSVDGGRASARPAAGTIVALFKPQFEAKKEEVPRGGVIKAPLMHATLIGRFVRWCTDNGFRVISMTASPILGAEGNREFLFWLRQDGGAAR